MGGGMNMKQVSNKNDISLKPYVSLQRSVDALLRRVQGESLVVPEAELLAMEQEIQSLLMVLEESIEAQDLLSRQKRHILQDIREDLLTLKTTARSQSPALRPV